MRLIIFLLLIGSYLFAQPFNPIFDKRNETIYWDNWDLANNYYYAVVDSNATDSTQTSKELEVQKGYDGLMQFVLQLDTLAFSAVIDTTVITDINGNSINIINPGGTNGTGHGVWYTIDKYINGVHGWQTMDTLRWVPYTNPAGTEIETFLVAHIADLYTSLFDPQATFAGEDGWMGYIPTPLRITRHVTVGDTTKIYQEKLYFKEHTPNR